MRDPMTLTQALAAAPTYRLASASLACVATVDDYLAWAARFVPLAMTLASDEKATLWKAMRAAAAHVGLEDRDVRAIVDEVMAATMAAEEVSHG